MSATLVLRQKYNALVAPVGLATGFHNGVGDVRMFRPFCHTARNAADGQIRVDTSIPLLLFASSPTKIAFFVMTVIINTVNRILRRWTLAHSITKVLKRGKSAFNAATAVSWISVRVGVVTSPKNASKNSIQGAVRAIMGGCLFNDSITGVTTARTGSAVDQVTALSKNNRAAFALAIPNSALALHTAVAQYGQAVKDFARVVLKIRTSFADRQNVNVVNWLRCRHINRIAQTC